MTERMTDAEIEALADNLRRMSTVLRHPGAIDRTVMAQDQAVAFAREASVVLRQLLAERKWRPIEEAPKDGTPFIGEDRDGDMCRMFWHDEFEAFVSKFNRIVMAPGYTINDKPYEDHSPVVHYPRRWFSIPQGTTPPQEGSA